MMPFEEKKLKKPNLFQRLIGQQPKENAVIEINNLLARKGVQNVGYEDINKIAEKYNFYFRGNYRNKLKDIYGNYLIYCLKDNQISFDEIYRLQHLKYLLNLNDHEVNEIHNKIAGKIYKSELDKVLQDRRLDDEERVFLERLQNDLRLPDKYARELYDEKSKTLLQNYLHDAFSDERLSPDEEEELNAISRSLGMDIPNDRLTQRKLNKYRLYWQIENGEIPEVKTDLTLPANEKCYFYTKIDWMEAREDNNRIKSNDNTMHFRQAQPTGFQSGSLGGYPVTEDVLITLDSGDLYVTNKRIIFKGKDETSFLKLIRIKNFAVYTNGVDIMTKGGKNPFFHFKENTELLGMILKRLLNL